jgi:hypothetical protein
MRRGSLALVAILVLGSLTKLLIPAGSSAPSGVENRTSGILSKAAPQPQETDLDKARKSAEWYPAQLREKIRDYFGVEHGPELDLFEGNVKRTLDPKAKGIGDVEHVCDSVENWCVPPGRAPEVRFVIATAPDPVHTHLGLFFDRNIDAIQQGATSQNYLFDRAIMPWQYFVEPVKQETDEEKLLRAVRESYPGLMIFRGAAAKTTLFIFVVGETPTAGINKEQFHRAVEIIHEIREGRDHVGPGEALDFGVLGPIFSGSLFSLREILDQYIQHFPADPTSRSRVIPVFSTVMGTDAIKSFDQGKPPQVRMTDFMEDGQTALYALLDHVCSLGYSSRDVAVLNEDDTQYGTSVSALASSGPCRQDVYAITFPRGISQFRSAYSKDLQIQSQPTDANQTQRRNLRLDLEVTGNDDDNVAPYAPTQTALSQEAIMLAIVSELRRREAKFIMVRATDALDELFLSRYLSSAYPDARLVVPTPDLLFAREEGGVVDGALGLSVYPVSPANLNQLCPSATGSKMFPAFPAASSVALYNATAALLGGFPGTGAATSRESNQTVESASAVQQSCVLSPHLWLTIVSRNSVNPIQVLRTKASLYFPASGSDAPEEHDRRSGRAQTPWAILCVLCLALAINHLWRLRNQNALGYWGTMVPPENPKHFWKGRDWILWLGAVALVGMLVVFISSVIPFVNPEHSLGTLLIAGLLGLSWLAFTAFITKDFYKARKKPTFAVMFAFVSLCFFVLGLLFAASKSTGMVLWQQRTLDLASQVSPATPLVLLFAAFYTWFWFSLKAESLIDWRSPRLPDSENLPKSYRRMTDSEAEGVRKVIPSFAPPRWVPIGALVVVGLISIRWIMLGPHGIPIRSLEGISYDVVYSLGFGLALCLLIATLLRTVVVWGKVQPLLGSLDRPGMRQALDRLKGFEWYTIWSPLQSMQDEARRLYSKEIHVVERLADSLAKDGGSANPDTLRPLGTRCKEILDCWEEICTVCLQGAPGGKPETKNLIDLLKKLEENLAQTAKVVWKDFLDPSWKALPADDGSDKIAAKTPDSSGTITVKGAVTESDVLLRTKIINAEIKEEDRDETGSSAQPRLSAKSLSLGEEFVACVYSTFITVVLLRIRWLVFSAVVIYTALVFSSISYPFQPAAGLRTLALFLFLLGAVAIGYVYEEMHRDPTLRNMTSTDPNKIDGAFWLKVATAGLLPLLGLLTSLFPQVGHFLYTIAAPILQATR